MRIAILGAYSAVLFILGLSLIDSEAQFTPADFGQTVNGFQDDFNGVVRDPRWMAVPADRDAYVQINGALRVHTLAGDPNHLLCAAAGYDPAVQEVLARIKVTAFGVGDPHNSGGDCRAGIGVGINTNSQGINLLFRDADHAPVSGRQFKLLDDYRAWGPPGLAINWENNVWYWLRLRQTASSSAGGANIQAKVWLADGTAPEPADWQMSWGRDGRTGFAGITGSSGGALAEFEVDYFLIKGKGLPNIKAGPGIIVLKDPADATVRPQQPATLRVTAAGFSPPTYQWQKANPGATNFVDIKDATGSEYTTQPLAAAASGTKYRCLVLSSRTSITSCEATVNVDMVPPALVSAKALGNPNKITVTFSEPVACSTNSDHFSIDNNIRVTGVGRGTNPETLELTTSTMTLGKDYILTVNGIQDQFGNQIYPNSQIPIDCDEKVISRIRLDQGHHWRPPFGLERIGRPLTAIVKIVCEYRPLKREYWLAGYSNGREIEQQVLHLRESGLTVKPPFSFTARVIFDTYPNELRLFAKFSEGAPLELAREVIQLPGFEAEAITEHDKEINPVDLGAILVPADRLLLAGGQGARINVAAICRTNDIPDARVMVWFESRPEEKVADHIALAKGRRVEVSLRLPAGSATLDRDVLQVAIIGGNGEEVWHKKVQTMFVNNPPHWPDFGATETKLRYDAPIPVCDPKTGTLSWLEYNKAWAPELKDVVVSLPNGSRFVFWRGANYVPFWAGLHNTGMCYEWAETTPPPDGYAASVEPLMDKDLRYSRVEIVESTAARVHVRWRYQACDFNYKVWGDQAVEDFYFYPDGLGTRVLSLKCTPGAPYEVLEFIVLTPAGAYPLEVLHPNFTDILFIDGQKRRVSFPTLGEAGSYVQAGLGESRNMSAIYRMRLHKDEAATAISFNPLDKNLPSTLFAPLFDKGYMVTPGYWGTHWPLARGYPGTSVFDNRLHFFSPAHNSLITSGLNNHAPASSDTTQTIDTLGRSKPMTLQRWVWLIGMTDATDERLLEWARSFTKPPSLELKGARLDFDSYVPERRAIRLIPEDKVIAITIKPAVRCVNPVFEFLKKPQPLVSVTLAEHPLDPADYAWDGQTLWLNATISQLTQLQLEFGSRPK